MEEKGKEYEPPTVKIYQFDDNDLILTASGEYAANALNGYFGGTNTTYEGSQF